LGAAARGAGLGAAGFSAARTASTGGTSTEAVFSGAFSTGATVELATAGLLIAGLSIEGFSIAGFSVEGLAAASFETEGLASDGLASEGLATGCLAAGSAAGVASSTAFAGAFALFSVWATAFSSGLDFAAARGAGFWAGDFSGAAGAALVVFVALVTEAVLPAVFLVAVVAFTETADGAGGFCEADEFLSFLPGVGLDFDAGSGRAVAGASTGAFELASGLLAGWDWAVADPCLAVLAWATVFTASPFGDGAPDLTAAGLEAAGLVAAGLAAAGLVAGVLAAGVLAAGVLVVADWGGTALPRAARAERTGRVTAELALSDFALALWLSGRALAEPDFVFGDPILGTPVYPAVETGRSQGESPGRSGEWHGLSRLCDLCTRRGDAKPRRRALLDQLTAQKNGSGQAGATARLM